MKKYHVATGDGKGYYGLGYESYREAVELLKISQSHDPQAHIVEEEYHFTNADRIRAMSDEELSAFLWGFEKEEIARDGEYFLNRNKITEWLKQPAQEE